MLRALAHSVLLLFVVASCGDSTGAVGTDTDATSTSSAVSSGEATVGPGSSEGSSEGSEASGDPPDPPENEAPVAAFDAMPPSGLAPLDVALDGSASTDADGTIVLHAWDLGDGMSAEGETTQATYGTAGCFEVELTVTDDDDATGTASRTIVVTDQAAGGAPEVELTEAPLPSAVLPRDLETNAGTAHFAGTVQSVGYAFVRAEVRDGATVVSTAEAPLCGAAPFAFELDVPIPAALVAHDVELSLVVGEQADPFASVVDLVAGDLYIIQGQSNAYANMFNGDANPENQGPFVRSFGINSTDGGTTTADVTWRVAEGNGAGAPGGVGQWGIRMAALLSEAHGVPIALFNGSLGGQPIGYFTRDDADPANLATNYGRLLARVRAAGVDQNLRGILWYQGESDGADFQTHLDGFVALYEDWLVDYPSIERTYVTQLRAGCGGGVNRTQEVQRQLADDVEAISVMSTTALNGHDGCHYAYEEGYKVLGERYAGLLGRDLYDAMPDGPVDAPNPATARFQNGGTEVVIAMRDEASALTFEDGAQADFVLEGAPGVAVVSGAAAEHEVTLTLSADGSAATGLTYLGRVGAAQWITNEAGIGMLTFFALPIDAE